MVVKIGTSSRTGTQPGIQREAVRSVVANVEAAWRAGHPTVLVTSGLLSQLTEAEEVTAVLAHEVAHLSHRHGLRSLIRILSGLRASKSYGRDGR